MIFEKENKRIIEDCFSRDDWMSNFIMIIVQNRSTSLHCLCFVIFYRKKCFFETEQVEQNIRLYRLFGAFYNLIWFLKMKQKNHSRTFLTNDWMASFIADIMSKMCLLHDLGCFGIFLLLEKSVLGETSAIYISEFHSSILFPQFN